MSSCYNSSSIGTSSSPSTPMQICPVNLQLFNTTKFSTPFFTCRLFRLSAMYARLFQPSSSALFNRFVSSFFLLLDFILPSFCQPPERCLLEVQIRVSRFNFKFAHELSIETLWFGIQELTWTDSKPVDFNTVHRIIIMVSVDGFVRWITSLPLQQLELYSIAVLAGVLLVWLSIGCCTWRRGKHTSTEFVLNHYFACSLLGTVSLLLFCPSPSAPLSI